MTQWSDDTVPGGVIVLTTFFWRRASRVPRNLEVCNVDTPVHVTGLGRDGV